MDISLRWKHANKDEYADMLWSVSKLPPLREWLDEHKPYLTTPQIHELLSAGFYIGCHSKSHPFCSRLSYAELEDEVIGSALRLGERFKCEMPFFAYPFGDRAPQEYEERMLQESSLQCLLGIYDTASHDIDYRRLEREGLEASSGIAVAKYFLGPFKKRASRLVHLG